MEVYDTEFLISALEDSNEQRGLLIQKFAEENSALKEYVRALQNRLVSTQRVPDCEHDNVRITEGGLQQCNECGIMLDKQEVKK